MVPGVQIAIQSPSPPNAPAVPGAQPMCTRCTRPSVFPPVSTTLVYYFFRFKYSQKKIDRGGVWEATVYYFILFVSVARAQIAADPAPAARPHLAAARPQVATALAPWRWRQLRAPRLAALQAPSRSS